MKRRKADRATFEEIVARRQADEFEATGLVTANSCLAWRCTFVSTNVTWGSTPPIGSLTAPENVANAVWAEAPMNVFVNASHVRDRDGLETALAPGDVVTILAAVSGG